MSTLNTESQAIRDLNGKYDVVLADNQNILTQRKSGKSLDGKTLDSVAMKSLAEKFDSNELEMKALQESIQLELKSIDYDKLQAARNQVENLPGQGRGNEGQQSPFKSLGQLFMESDAIKNIKDFNDVPAKGMDIALKSYKNRGLKTAGSDITLSTNPLFTQQLNEFVGLPVFPPTIMDFLPKFEQNQNSYEYYRQTARQNNAARQSAEMAPLVKSGWTSDLKTVTAYPVGTFFKLSETQLQDNNNIRSILDSQAELALMEEAERQLLTGTGSGEMEGLYNITGKGTYARTGNDENGKAYNNADALSFGLSQARVTGVCNPGLIIIHPDNMQVIRMMKDENGQYLYGGPNAPSPGTIWGIKTLETPRATSGSAVIADLLRYTRLGIRLGANIVLERMEDDLTALAMTLRIYMRMSFEATRPLAINTVTNLA